MTLDKVVMNLLEEHWDPTPDEVVLYIGPRKTDLDGNKAKVIEILTDPLAATVYKLRIEGMQDFYADFEDIRWIPQYFYRVVDSRGPMSKAYKNLSIAKGQATRLKGSLQQSIMLWEDI